MTTISCACGECVECALERELIDLREQLRLEQDARMKVERQRDFARGLVRLICDEQCLYPDGIRVSARNVIRRWDAERDIAFAFGEG